MTKLKPCPFCGGEAKLIDDDLSYVICTECGIHPYHRISLRDAIEAWNTRPNPWHTGTPTENGDYWVAFRWGLDNEIMHDMASHVLYGATAFVNGNWRIDFPYVVVAWQKIEPYKEKEDGCTD